MIVIMNDSINNLYPSMLSDLERRIVSKKQASPMIYRYPSMDALMFELRMRSNIVQAAKDMNASDVGFATFSNSRCNPQYWIRTPNGGFLLRPGVPPSVGINDIFQNGQLYAFECAGAIIIMLYKAVLSTIGEPAFNYYFQNLFLRDWQYDRDLRLITTYNLAETYPGDVLYFKNPDHHPATPEWQGENVIMLDENLYFGHGIGMGTGQEMIAALNRARRPGSMVSAYLQNLVLTPDFEAVRRLTMREQVEAEEAALAAMSAIDEDEGDGIIGAAAGVAAVMAAEDADGEQLPV
ncbi:protein-glutamine gamma-glutamyltransferase [Paenibacillus sp. J5C_2022]|uniref:protein-glutamine gamma-glutamyltransferase n=1 Tax=Paenibacillus sp. J5C2022 TaxID=2977129 RepID=UPI0021CE1FE3|nr:protein-glutamine gamma-glutamyltransferase [Paenibacillus sp. J5C2022]MCU6712247.1 protein-glutamine gamma-glutamyltransferase [Paenibacillus sp. J5C2022]